MDGDLMRARAAGAFTRPGRGGRVRLRPSAAMGRWLMLLVALAGLMAMHGLSDHGVGGLAGAAGQRAGVAVASSPGTASSTSMASGASQSGHAFAADHADHAAKTAVVGGTSSSQPAGESGDGHGGHGGHGELLLGVCLAVLAAGLLLRVLLGAFRPLGMFPTRLVDQAAAAGVAVRARARGPACPDLRLLAIQRC